MTIITNLDVMLAKRKMSSKGLAEKIGITNQNLSILKTGKAKAIRFSTLESICKILQCQPGDIFEYQEEKMGEGETLKDLRQEGLATDVKASLWGVK